MIDDTYNTPEYKSELERLKTKYKDDYVENNEYLNLITDEIYLRFIEVNALKKYKNPYLIYEKLPPLFALIDIRQKIKKFSVRSRANIKILRMLFTKRKDKEFMNKLKIKYQKILNQEFKKRGLDTIDFEKYEVE